MSGKIIKKAVALLMSAAVFLSGVFCAAAAETVYNIPEIDDMAVTLPDGMTAVTRQSSENDRYFSVFGLSYNSVIGNFESGNIYLQGMDSNSKMTVTVTMEETEESKGIINYNLLSPEKLNEVSRNFLSNAEYTACTPDTADKIIWLFFDANVASNGKKIAAYQANTVYDGKSVSVTLQRNSGNILKSDYELFTKIVKSVDFKKSEDANIYLPYIIIGAAVLLIIIVILIILVSRSTARRRKKNRNDRLLQELAGEYTSSNDSETKGNTEPEDTSDYFIMGFTDRKSDSFEEVGKKTEEIGGRDLFSSQNISDKAVNDNDAPEEAEAEFYAEAEEQSYENYDGYEAYEPVAESEPAVRREVHDYTDDDINAILAYNPDEGSFDDSRFSMPEAEIAGELSDSESRLDEDMFDSYEPETYEDISSSSETAEIKEETADEAESEASESNVADAEEGVHTEEPEETDGSADGSTRKFVIEKKKDRRSLEQALANQAELQRAEEIASENTENPEKKRDIDNGSRIYSFDTFDDSIREGRDISNAVFDDSDDFFDEAPDTRTIGVISGEEILSAEDYDVIGEEEQRAVKVENSGNGESSVLKAVKKIGEGIGSFFVHCGYFVTNVSRSVKRKRNMKKRKQAELERRQAARARAEKQRARVTRSQNGELVQVHRRSDSQRKNNSGK